jgi:hypothetical protein
MSYLDKTFCASPNCKNKCGRKMTEEDKNILDILRPSDQNVWYGYFCGHPREYTLDDGSKSN